MLTLVPGHPSPVLRLKFHINSAVTKKLQRSPLKMNCINVSIIIFAGATIPAYAASEHLTHQFNQIIMIYAQRPLHQHMSAAGWIMPALVDVQSVATCPGCDTHLDGKPQQLLHARAGLQVAGWTCAGLSCCSGWPVGDWLTVALQAPAATS